jgi:soluble lytic murein transglycosylase
MLHRAELNSQLRNWEKAIYWYRKYETAFGPLPNLVYQVARSYRYLGKSKEAEEWYLKHIRLYPNNERSLDILWYLADCSEEKQDYKKAQSYYLQLIKINRKSSKAADARFRIGLNYFRTGEYGSAFSAFDSLTRRGKDASNYRASLYWKSRTLIYLRDPKAARDFFIDLAKSEPTDYYAYLSRNFLSTFDTTLTNELWDTTVSQQAVKIWIDSLSDATTKVLTRSDSLNLFLGRMLAASGQPQPASAILEPLAINHGNDAALHYELSRLYATAGDPALSYKSARRLYWRIPSVHKTSMPLPVVRCLYPDFYRDSILVNAQRFEVEPELVSAVIRQESIFDKRIVSPVGAIGLMQIMPYTGKEIADDLNNTFDVDSLYIASFNIRFGTYYLHKLLKKFDGEFAYAIAGYNGGPHNVNRWLKSNPVKDIELFIEDIPYTETRGYVKKVLANYWTYKQFADYRDLLKKE